MFFLKGIIIFLVGVQYSNSTISEGVVFVVIDQPASLHHLAAQHLASDLTHQAHHLAVECKVYIASEEWPGTSAWTYFPLLERLASSVKGRKWIVVLGERVRVDLQVLLQVLDSHDPTQMVFLGRGVSDQQESIIHHYDLVDLTHPVLYPDTRAGMVLSLPLLHRLAKEWIKPSKPHLSEFTIDAAYEFSAFVRSVGVELKNHSSFCLTEGPGCGVVLSRPPLCEKRIHIQDIHFAVKSCSHFHSQRLPIIQQTWLPDAKNYAIYSDVQDVKYNTVSLGVPNTDRGHCGKTLAIIRHASRLQGMKWLAVVDDDTLISVPRLSEVLSCYEADELVALGERYGFATRTSRGYDYLTGGAGMVFSKALVDELASPGVCECPTDDTPDDMFLGMCLQRLHVPATHSPAFHQARPIDYPEAVLEGEALVSFHKFWMVDPLEVYNRHLRSHTHTSPPASPDNIDSTASPINARNEL